MIELMILGFLAEGPLHGYELRRRMAQLHGSARTISDGTIYPAINRLIAAGALTQELRPGSAAAPRRILSLTDDGRQRLQQRLRNATGHDITDRGRFAVVLAFLSLVPDDADRRAVLARRLAYLERPMSLFSEDGRPLRAEDIDDPYRCGIFVTAIAASSAERAWLRELLAESTDDPENG